MIKTLEKLDIVISVYNQENLIRKVLYGVFKNTTTPFNLILVFDGCTDHSEAEALSFIKKYKPANLGKLTIERADNVYETRANNIGFRLAKEDYMITVQDDMVIKEFGWEQRLAYPLRKFDDVLAVTARSAHDIKYIDGHREDYINIAAKERDTLPRNVFAVRDIINRGPVVFRMDYLRTLNYLNEDYAPVNLDDAELSLRAWTQHKWKVGSFWIKYVSPTEWGKARAKDSTMSVVKSNSKNAQKISIDFADYLNNKQKHSQDIIIEESEIDYSKDFKNSEWIKAIIYYPTYSTLWGIKRTFKRRLKNLWHTPKSVTKQGVVMLLATLKIVDAQKVKEVGLKKTLRHK